MNLSTYLIAKKMEYARELLINETKNVKEVAALMGYKNVNNFKTQY